MCIYICMGCLRRDDGRQGRGRNSRTNWDIPVRTNKRFPENSQHKMPRRPI